MRIGIDARMYSTKFTGIGRYNAELIKNLLEIDSENEYVIFLNAEEFTEFPLEKPNVSKILADFKHYSWQEQTNFLKLINQSKIDLMHFTHFNAPIFYQRPFVITIHDLTLSFFPGKKMTSILHRLAYQLTIRTNTRKAKKVIAVSQNTQKDIIKLLKIPAEKITVTYEGTDANFKVLPEKILEETKTKYNFQKPFLLYSGVWRNHKNLMGLIRAYGKLVQEKNFEADLIVTGRADPTYSEVLELTQKLNLQKRIKFVGLVPEEDLIAIYNLAKIYVFPSFYEGFGLPPLEAMACGTPVCASHSSCIPEICGTENAIFFDPYDLEDIAAKIWELYQDEALQQKLIQNGFKRIQDFSWKKMAEETLEIYKQTNLKK